MHPNVFEVESYVLSYRGVWCTLLFGPFALALLCYIRAFCSQSHKLPAFREFIVLSLKRREQDLRGTQHIFYSAFTLLVFDGLTLIFGLVWSILLLCDNLGVALIIFINIWVAFRILSQCQHLITALVSIIFLYHPSWGDCLRSISKALDLVPFILVVLSFRIDDNILIGVDVYNFLLAVGIVVSWCLSSSSPVAKQRKPIGLLSMSLYFLVCLPFAVFTILLATPYYDSSHAVDGLFITNFYIVMNAVLFYLVLKLNDADPSENRYECAIRSE